MRSISTRKVIASLGFAFLLLVAFCRAQQCTDSVDTCYIFDCNPANSYCNNADRHCYCDAGYCAVNNFCVLFIPPNYPPYPTCGSTCCDLSSTCIENSCCPLWVFMLLNCSNSNHCDRSRGRGGGHLDCILFLLLAT